MSKREVKTDLWVAGQLDKCGIQYTPQGSDVKEIGEALSSASKRGTGKTGFPEYVAVVNDFVIVIEDKADLGQHIKLTDSGILDTSTKAVTDFAVNGAYFYAKHIAQKSSFRKVFAIGVSGDSRHHKISLLISGMMGTRSEHTLALLKVIPPKIKSSIFWMCGLVAQRHRASFVWNQRRRPMMNGCTASTTLTMRFQLKQILRKRLGII